jgi:NADPH:quinone reductase-like Zn-dependent oxidoreductase
VAAFSVVSPFLETHEIPGTRTAFFFVEVTTARLNALTELFEQGKLRTRVGTVPPLEKAKTAYEMLAGTPHERGKIVLQIARVDVD